jgi:hypothetical protein
LSTFTDHTNELLKSAKDLAEGINKDILRLRADRLDRILNEEMMPYLALHSALIGACIVLAQFGSWPSLFILFSFIATGFFLTYYVSIMGTERQAGMLGAGVVFATAAASCAPISPLQAGIVVIVAYALVGLLATLRKSDPEEFLFAPVYSAIMMQVSGVREYQVVLYLIVFGLGIITLMRLGRIQMSFGLFAGMLVILWSEVDKRTSGQWGLVVICVLSICALLAYVFRAVEAVNSDFRNFLSQGLVALTTLAIICIFMDDSRPFWLWPIGLGFLFAFVHVLRGRAAGIPTSVAWTCIAITGAIWLCATEAGQIASLEFRICLVATLVTAEGLYVAGRALRNRFACNLALLLLLAGGALCLLFAGLINGELVRYLKDRESTPFRDVIEILSWKGWAIVVAPALTSLATFFVALSYRSGSVTRPVSWWRGLVKPRHAVLVRTGFRVSVKWFTAVPIVGAALKAIEIGAGSLRYLKTGAEPFRFADLAVLASTVTLGFSVIYVCDPFLAAVNAMAYGGQSSPEAQSWGWLSHTIAWTGCALVVYLYGLSSRQTLFIFAGGGFALVPIVGYLATAKPVYAQQLGVIALTGGLALVLCSIVRKGVKPVAQKAPVNDKDSSFKTSANSTSF